MNILVTGAHGFLGSYLLENYATEFNFIPWSVTKSGLDISGQDFDSIIHLASIVHQDKSIPDEEYFRVNVDNTLELAKQAKDKGAKSFLFLSTVKVYGEERDEAYTETSHCDPQDGYGKSKLKAEEELLKLSCENFKVIIIRSPLIYGPKPKANMKSLLGLVNKLPIIPLGGTNNKRTIVFIGNLCDMIIHSLKKNLTGVYLASDEYALSTTELVKKISSVVKKKRLILYIPLLQTMVKILAPGIHQRLFQSLWLDNTESLKKLDFRPKHSSDEGLKTLLD